MKHRREKCWGEKNPQTRELVSSGTISGNLKCTCNWMPPKEKSQIFKEIFAENFLILMKTINSQICNKA